MNILIKKARLIDWQTDKKADLLIINDKIAKISSEIKSLGLEKVDRVIEADGYIVMPSFVDTHAHFREPGFTYKEDIKTGMLAAINGGYTFVNLMANTKPVCDNLDVINYVQDKSKDIGICGINQTIALTKELLGKDIIDVEKLPKEVNILSDDGKDLLSNHMMYKAAKICAKYNKTIMVHAEDAEISSYDYRVAEDLITYRDVYLSGKTGCHIHMSHVSTIDSVDIIRYGKIRGYNVTCEVTPHHISMYNSDYKVNPPIRKEEDVDAMIEAIKDGTVDCIGTDHAPHSVQDKENGSPGMVGIETAFSVCNTYLVREGHIDYKKLSEIMSFNPAKILRQEGIGELKVGNFADLVIVDNMKEVIIDSKRFKSKSRNTPYENMKMYGEVLYTIYRGDIVKDDNR